MWPARNTEVYRDQVAKFMKSVDDNKDGKIEKY